MQQMQRVSVYVDGFNLYYGLKSKGWRRYYWLNLYHSGDSDLSGTVETVRRRYPEKRVIAAFPPNRISLRLRQAATASFVIGRAALRDSQMPEQVAKADGYVLAKPSRWS